MVVVGVDPGSRVTGYGVVELSSSRPTCLDFGAITTQGSGDADGFAGRLERIYGELDRVLERHHPQVVAVEDVFHAVNARSALKLGHVRGVVLLAAARRGIPLVEYSPLEVKKAVAGYGRADKAQVQHMVGILLSLKSKPRPFDAADALAVALCHAFRVPRSRSVRRGA